MTSKTMKQQLQKASSYISIIVAALLSACSTDDPVPAAHDPQANSEVTFAISLPQGIGDGSSASPAMVRNGETLDMTISQTSSYTDPDGSVFTCEPQAVVSLSARVDTVYAKTLEDLTRVAESPAVETNQTGTSPVCHRAVQTFCVGGQDIVFDLSHEVYTYVSSTGRHIEMPYMMPGRASLGGHGTVKGETTTRSAAVVSAVTVRPLPDTRAAVEVTTTYEVNVRFSLDLESRNAKSEAGKTLEFAVSYVGVTETAIEPQEPVAELAYAWDVKRGTGSTAPPFVGTKGKAMEVWLAQTSTYTDEYGNRAVGEPKAKIRLSVEKDTVWAKTLDELKALAEKGDRAADGLSAHQEFGSALQTVSVDWSCEAGEAELIGKTVPMPFYALTPVTLKDVSTTEKSEELIGGKPISMYEVTATFSQKAVAKNVTTETPEVEIEYIVKYVGAVEISLVKVEYYPGGIWIDPHDNLDLAFFAKVERYRTYSNGQRLGPDEFYDFGHFTRPFAGGGSSVRQRYDYEDGSWEIEFPWVETNQGDSIVIATGDTQLSQLGQILFKDEPLMDRTFTKFKDWDNYSSSGFYIDDYFSFAKDFDNPSYPADSRASAWYYAEIGYQKYYFVHWKPTNKFEYPLDANSVDFMFYDQFLVIDGRRIDFSALHNLKVDISFSESDFEDAQRKGKTAKLEMHATYLGKNFYCASIQNFYVVK